MSESPTTEAAHDATLRTFQVWRDAEGDFLVWGRWTVSTRTESLIREFRSANWMSAHLEAFGERPRIDRNILDLVMLLNEVPGVMTRWSCQGHRQRGDADAYVLIHLDGLDTLYSLVDLIERADPGGPFWIHLHLTYRILHTLPAGALAFNLRLSVWNRQGFQRPPLRRELARFTERLRAEARKAGLLGTPANGWEAGARASVRFLRGTRFRQFAHS